MPKSTVPSKSLTAPARTRTRTRTNRNKSPDPSLSDDTASKEDFDQEEIQDEDNNANLLAAMIRQIERQSKKSSSARSAIFLSQKKALYAEARKNVKVIVQAGNDLLEDFQEQLAKLQNEEVGFPKYSEDSHLPVLAQEVETSDAFHGLSELYPLLLQDTGASRAERINSGFRLLRTNGQSRQDVLKESSKNARQQLEQAKQIEKDAVDAAELIKHIKNLLRG